MSEENSAKDKVYEAYTKHADKIWEDGYRFNPVYIASKALSDWLLLTSVDLTGKQVLNIGCAEPIDEIQFIEKVSKWVALDINEKLIKTAEEIARRKLNPMLFSKLEFVHGDATALNFDDNTFDIVVSFSTIEHIPDPQARQKVFKEISRVLKPGGVAVITMPNKISTFYFAHRRNMRLGISDYGYAHLYTPGELKKSLLAAGLKTVTFASEYSALITLPSILPRFISRFLSIFRYFGERIGYLAIKDGTIAKRKYSNTPHDIPENIYGHRKRLLWIIKQIENRNTISKPKGKIKVLEIGCGTGTMISIPLASLGYDVLGIDLDKKSIDFANSANPHANAKFICCDVAELNDSYDVIILSEVLEHLSDPGNLLKACHGILTTQGVLLVTVPNGYGWFEFEQFLWDKLRLGNVLEFLRISRTITLRKMRLIENYEYWDLYPSTLSSSPHVQRFTFGKIRRLVMRNGFSILDVEGSTLIAGKFSNLLLTGFKTPMKMNNWLGTMIKPLASGFYLCCHREEH